ncbi:MAG: 1-acyl-sn-glycerol-3-phosphate acyltransferase [Paludibacter sp.]|nr:1-acyl-sn-glycerol-3-phosphate acyltransferase [Paludibacter sp.]
MSKIYELPLSFRLVKKYIRFTFKRFYSEFIVLGKENIPSEGQVIFAPNHLNALMDALAVHSISPDNYATVFLARSDIFRKKVLARILRACKIMPAFRIRDGIENLGKNNEVFDKCVEVLESKNAMGIMPEGNQELERKIRPLVKGIFRVAFSAQQKIGTSGSVKIVPVGIDMGDLYKFGKHIIINIGKPIVVSEYMPKYAENQPATTNEIRNDLSTALGNLVVNLNTDKYYPAFEVSTQLCNTAMLESLQLKKSTINLFYARQEIGRKLVGIEQTHPELAQKLDTLCADFEHLRKKLNLHINNFEQRSVHSASTVLKAVGLLLSSPVFLLGFALNFLPFFTPVLVRKKLKVKFEGFFTSIHYVVGILCFPVFYLLQAILFFSISGLSWWLFLLFIPLQYLSGKWAYSLYKHYKKTKGEINHSIIKTNKENDYKRLLQLRSAIIDIVMK